MRPSHRPPLCSRAPPCSPQDNRGAGAVSQSVMTVSNGWWLKFVLPQQRMVQSHPLCRAAGVNIPPRRWWSGLGLAHSTYALLLLPACDATARLQLGPRPDHPTLCACPSPLLWPTRAPACPLHPLLAHQRERRRQTERGEAQKGRGRRARRGITRQQRGLCADALTLRGQASGRTGHAARHSRAPTSNRATLALLCCAPEAAASAAHSTPAHSTALSSWQR